MNASDKHEAHLFRCFSRKEFFLPILTTDQVRIHRKAHVPSFSLAQLSQGKNSNFFVCSVGPSDLFRVRMASLSRKISSMK